MLVFLSQAGRAGNARHDEIASNRFAGGKVFGLSVGPV